MLYFVLNSQDFLYNYTKRRLHNKILLFYDKGFYFNEVFIGKEYVQKRLHQLGPVKQVYVTSLRTNLHSNLLHHSMCSTSMSPLDRLRPMPLASKYIAIYAG